MNILSFFIIPFSRKHDRNEDCLCIERSVKDYTLCSNKGVVCGFLFFPSPSIKGVRTRMFRLIIHLPFFDPCVLFCCLVFSSVSSSTDVHNCA